MSWLWLGILAVTGAALWVRRRRMLHQDAMLQESLDRLSSYSDEPKRPPAKQPWRRPGFGPPVRMSQVNLGDGPLPPAAGETEDPSVAGPVPDEDDVPALIPVESDADPEPASDGRPPPPPPPGAGATEPEPEPPEATAPDDDTADDVVIAADDVELAVVRGPRVLDLPPELEDEVRELMGRHQEVAAVRLVCDAMGVGIIDAQRTIRALRDR